MLFTLITDQERRLPLYISGCGVQVNQEHTRRPEGYLNYQWTYCTKGSGVFLIDGKSFTIRPGSCFFFGPDIPHEYFATSEPWETLWITFDGAQIATLLKLFGIENYEAFPTDVDSILPSLYYEIENDLLRDNPEKVIETSAKLYQLLLHFKKEKRDAHLKDHPLQQRHRLEPVISFMNIRYDQPLSLDDLSAQIQVTPHHLCKLFKQAFDLTPFQYLIQIRIQKAKQLLIQSPELGIKDVAERVSYSDTSYFCAIFKKHEQISPLTFRKIHGF